MSDAVKDDKRRTKIKIAFITIVLLVAVIVIGFIYKSQQKYTPPKQVPKIDLQKKTDLAKESWVAQSSTQMKEQDKLIKDLRTELDKMKADNKGKEGDRKLPSMPPGNPPMPEGNVALPPAPPSSQKPGGLGNFLVPPPPAGTTGQAQQGSPQPQRVEKVMTNLIAIEEGKPSAGTQAKTKPDSTQKDKSAQQDASPSAEEKASVKKSGGKNAYIPAGTFVKVVLLSGVDAPTGAKAKASPYPVLLKIVDTAQLPNRWKSDINECFVVGEAMGELSSERLQVRGNTLSCVSKSGELLESTISSYLVGEDGKTGFSARISSKQGSILARGLVAGFLQGVSQAFQQSSTVMNVTPTGNISTIDPSKTAQAGLGAGVSKSAEELAKFYMSLASEMFPTAEVNSGRTGELVFLNKTTLNKVVH